MRKLIQKIIRDLNKEIISARKRRDSFQNVDAYQYGLWSGNLYTLVGIQSKLKSILQEQRTKQGNGSLK